MVNNSDPLFNLIYAYTRKQAVEDGNLIDVTAQAKESGFKVPVCVSLNLHAKYITPPSGLEGEGQSVEGRLHDLFTMCLLAMLDKLDQSRVGKKNCGAAIKIKRKMKIRMKKYWQLEFCTNLETVLRRAEEESCYLLATLEVSPMNLYGKLGLEAVFFGCCQPLVSTGANKWYCDFFAPLMMCFAILVMLSKSLILKILIN
ncbi:DUF6573 family protein [Maridesulfovibrio zosterae]|uniref:DUF6573 family protein n=1 Tax=Maridesulfovibrio zosterae TaxID=82171 RepID=UPI0004205F6D